jgi:hypothetical protein
MLATLILSVKLMKHICLVEPELDRNQFYSEKKEAIKALILILATLVIIRPLVMLGLSHGYFPIKFFFIELEEGVSYFMSFHIQDIQLPIMSLLAFAQLMIFLLIKSILGFRIHMFFVPKRTMDEEFE